MDTLLPGISTAFLAMEDSSNSVVEERSELMVSPSGRNLKLRKAHFIKPSISSIDGTTVSKRPRHCFSSLLTTSEPKKWPLEVKFHGWIHPQKDWKIWVEKMASLHESTWKKAGIFEAIMNSTYKIERNNDLVFGLAEKWCPETKSFIFSWGEATITLEDVMILGGYSVLGSPVFTPVGTGEMKETREKLRNARKEIYKSTQKKACQYVWMKKFMHSDDRTVEHAAFLALWLSRFVLPSSYNTVVESVFPIAIHLSRGTRIALAPAVLASIYRDLSLLKQSLVVASTRPESNCDVGNAAVAITLYSPIALVQVWIWERFLDLHPWPNLVKNDQPRFALWHNVKPEVQNLCSVLDSAKEERFVWRPYVRKITNCDGSKFYEDNAMWMFLNSRSDDELLSFVRCLRASELVGLDCMEQYLPHRVALQFGMDQDIPGSVPRSNGTPVIAWTDYNKSIYGEKLYIPARLFEAGVTTRYWKWWKQSVLSLQEDCKDVLRMSEGNGFPGSKTTVKKSKRAREGTSATTRADVYRKMLKRSIGPLELKKGENASMLHEYKVTPSVPPGFPPKEHVVQAKGFVNEDNKVTPSVHPAFPIIYIDEDEGTAGETLRSDSKHDSVGNKECRNDDKSVSFPRNLSMDPYNEDQLTVAEMLKSHHKHGNVGEWKTSAGQCQSTSSSIADNGYPVCKELPTTLAEQILPAEATSGGSNRATPQDDIGRNAGYIDLEARISRLERLVAEIKAARKAKSMVTEVS